MSRRLTSLGLIRVLKELNPHLYGTTRQEPARPPLNGPALSLFVMPSVNPTKMRKGKSGELPRKVR